MTPDHDWPYTRVGRCGYPRGQQRHPLKLKVGSPPCEFSPLFAVHIIVVITYGDYQELPSADKFQDPPVLPFRIGQGKLRYGRALLGEVHPVW